jgi:tetratricopeptide (TPR) repeat protein
MDISLIYEECLMLGTDKAQTSDRKSSETTSSLLSQVNKLVTQGLRQAAIDLLEEAVSYSPNDSSLLSALGRVYLLNRQPDKAVVYLRRSLAQSSSNPVYNNDYAPEAFTEADAGYLEERAEDPSNDEFSILDEVEATDTVDERPKENSSRTLHLNGNGLKRTETTASKGNESRITVVKNLWKRAEPEQPIAFVEKPACADELSVSAEIESDTDIEAESLTDAIEYPEYALTNDAPEPPLDPQFTAFFIQAETRQLALPIEYESEEADEEIELPELDSDVLDVIDVDDDFDDDLDEAGPELNSVESSLLDDDSISEDFGWEDLDDFEEDANRDNEDEELAQKGITRAARARQVAIEVLSRVEWDREHLPLLEAIFVESGWGAARVAIEDQIERGAVPEEILLARHVRSIWFSSEHLWTCFRMKSNAPCMQADAVYRNFSWVDALRLVRCFPTIPDEAEIEAFIDELYDEWYSHNRLRKHFKAFLKYLHYRIIATKRTLPSDIGFMFSSPVEEEWGADNPELISSISEMRAELRKLGADGGFEVHGADHLFKVLPKEAFDDEKESK